MKWSIPLFAPLLAFLGCASQPTGHFVEQQTKQASYYRWDSPKGRELFHLEIDHETGAYVLIPVGEELPTMKQLSEFFDEGFKRLASKLEKGEVLTNQELTLLSCCLNVAICRMEIMNDFVFSAFDLPDTSETHKFTTLRKSIRNPDLTRREAMRDSDTGFVSLLRKIADDFYRGDNKFGKGVTSFGRTFNSGEDARVNLIKEERSAVFSSLVKNEYFDSPYLDHSWFRNFGTIFLFSHYNASNRPLPDYKKAYDNRWNNVQWIKEYRDASMKFDVMRVSIQTNLLKTSSVKDADEMRRRDVLADISKALQNERIGVADASLVAQEFPFALGMMECMKMMDEYYRYEKLWNTPDESQRKYKQVAKTLVRLADCLGLDHIENKPLRELYEANYVRFLEKVLTKSTGGHVTADELYADKLIPFMKTERSK